MIAAMNQPWVNPFLEALAASGIVSDAAKAVGVSQTTLYRHRKADADFEAAWDIAVEEAVDEMELEARRRAVTGITRDIYYKGDVVGEEQVYSDSLLMFMLKGRRRAIYGDKQEITGKDGGALAFTDETKKASRIAALLELARTRKDVG